MNQLVVITPIASSVPVCLADAAIATAIGYAEQAKSPGTRRAYGSDWRCARARGDAGHPGHGSPVSQLPG